MVTRRHLWGVPPSADKHGGVQEEFEAVMLPRHGQGKGLVARRRGAGSGELPYERLAPSWRLPTAVDWRGTGADGLVKDQATCGSCWAFGATAALQSAYWAATGAGSKFRHAAHHQMLLYGVAILHLTGILVRVYAPRRRSSAWGAAKAQISTSLHFSPLAFYCWKIYEPRGRSFCSALLSQWSMFSES